ncbi:MAG: EF-hand domain-containing protein [Candidatus Sericytochromatia bacterium]|nr:EF-hand domain-containing protein [Candidatus Sericytochromatia bacterium]
MTAISSIVNQVFNRYDVNGDNHINLKPGGGFEGTRLEREFQSGFDYDTITLTRYSHEKLFRAADANNDGLVSRTELADAVKLFDTNGDGQLKNSGPFWNRKGELRNFERGFPERAEILDQRIIPRPRPIHPVPPHHPLPPRPYGEAAGLSLGVRIA